MKRALFFGAASFLACVSGARAQVQPSPIPPCPSTIIGTPQYLSDQWCMDNLFLGKLFVSANPNIPNASSPALANFMAQDNQQSMIGVFSSGTAANVIVGENAAGTFANPLPTLSGTALAIIGGGGYDGTWQTARFAGMRVLAKPSGSAWTTADHGSAVFLYSILAGQTVVTQEGIIQNGLQIGSPTGGAEGPGTINAQNYCGNGVCGVSCAAGTVNLTTYTVTNGIVTHC